MPVPAAPTPAEQVESTRLRLTFLALLIVSLFVLLLTRLWFLQVMAGGQYAEAAETNAYRTVAIEAPRGRILDREGEPLVENRYAMVVSVQPSQMGDREDAILADLADLLGIPRDEIDRRIETSRASALRPKPIAIDVPDATVFYIHENGSTRYPGVYAESLPRRAYPHGTLAAHVVGYVGEISDAELADPEYEGYEAGALIGWAGLERTYEDVLRGVEGTRTLEVDRNNEVVGELPLEPPQPGSDIRTTIDLDAQRLAEEALVDGIQTARTINHADSGRLLDAPAGAVVVLDPRNGQVRAMASFPTYDPDEFVGGVGQEYWDQLQDEGNHFPLINRAISAAFPPGSVFKTVSASAALDNGFMTHASTRACPAEFEWGEQVFRNWNSGGEAPMNLSRALLRSCDTVFYSVAQDMWLAESAAVDRGEPAAELLSNEAREYGYGTLQGVDLPGEKAGVVPGRTWKREFHATAATTYCEKAQTLPPGQARDINADLCQNGDRWRGGDAVNMSIGQGDLQATPLQVANAFALIANGGTLWRPHVVGEVHHRDGTIEPLQPEALSGPPTHPTNLAYMEQGLVGVTSDGDGTAAPVFRDFPVTIAGKTGTAELRPKQPYAWFAGYNVDPVDGEEYVVVAMVEQGGGGSTTAAPIAKRVFEGLFGLEESEITPGLLIED